MACQAMLGLCSCIMHELAAHGAAVGAGLLAPAQQPFTTSPFANTAPPQMSPLGDRLLVKPQEVESKTAGGIL